MIFIEAIFYNYLIFISKKVNMSIVMVLTNSL